MQFTVNIPISWPWLAVAATTSYLLVVRKLRYRRVNKLLKQIHSECGLIDRSEDMPLHYAELLVKNIHMYEFPRIMILSLQFALFRTYAIPSISKLLSKTRQLVQRSNSHRRYVDTSVLVIEFMTFPLVSRRAQLAIERMNYLHSRHKGAISNDDLLYTLSLFMCQPVVFVDKYEWRKLHPLERIAMHRYWIEVGKMMGITGIPGTYDDVYAWANAYEEKYMIHADTNTEVATATVDILLYFIPKPMHGVAGALIRAICDSRLRAAFAWPDPPSWADPAVKVVFQARAFLTRHLFLPRFQGVYRSEAHPINPDAPYLERRYYYNLWDTDPWYLEENWWNTWGPTGWICRAMGWSTPHKDIGGRRGFRLGDIGPLNAEGKGAGNPGWRGDGIVGEGVTRTTKGSGGCPMFMG